MICFVEQGWYKIADPPEGITPEKWAKDNGELNSHIRRIETLDGKILWSREQ